MNKYGTKKIYLFFSSICLFLLHMLFVFAKTKPAAKSGIFTKQVAPHNTSDDLAADAGTSSAMNKVYDSLRLGTAGLGKQVFDYAVRGFASMKQMGKVANDGIISIVDFSKPSSEKRLFIIDVKNCKVLFNTYVAHGVNSGKEMANHFSNSPESLKSSLGFYETMETYIGGNGYSLRLQGVERGINDNANKRDIVIHGADYVNESLIRSQGYIGRSYGCPAVSQKLSRSIIDKIKNGTCLFIYGEDKKYLSRSPIINRSTVPLFAYNDNASFKNKR